MARTAREKSESGLYHVMIRGINHQQIFEDNDDCEKFLSLLERYKEECTFELSGYCLMGNHVHLLIRENEVSLQTIFRKIGASYVYYFNQKYERVGHLFQDRYRSETIRNENQLLSTLRYIHMNPVKAGLCANPAEYKFSSYDQYAYDKAGIADTELILSIVTPQFLTEFTKAANEDEFLDIREKFVKRPSDREAKEIMKEISGCDTVSSFQNLDKDKRDLILAYMRDRNLSITQINRLTGVSRTIISRAKKQKKQ